MDEISPPAPEARVGFLIYRAGLAVARGYERALAPLGMTPAEAGVLSALAYSGPAHVRELARRLGIGRQSAVNVTKALLAQGQIARIDGGADARLVVYGITPKGQERLAASEGTIGAFDRAVSEILGPDIVPTVSASLHRLVTAETLAHDD
jgi:DNA-binding MarR family transcriptional regulator